MAALRPHRVLELGTHNGFSLFVFAEAARRLGITPRVTAFDTWEGDDQAGFYGPEVLESVRAIAESDYPEIVELRQGFFADLVDEVSDGSVDLLHIDGRHGYEDVKADYDLYSAKLSPRGVVLFHDIAEHQEGFGVYRLWEELAQAHPSFAFKHGHGLGVLLPGTDPDPLLMTFVDAANAEPDRYRAFYANRGAEISRQFVLEVEHIAIINDLRARLADLEAQEVERLAMEHRQLELVDRIFGLEAQLAETSSFMNPSREKMSELENVNAVLSGQIGAMERSVTWRIGRAATLPGRAIRRVLLRR